MTSSEFGVLSDGNSSGSMKNDRGVALLIVLLVTALLTALIVEFAYGTRVSLRSAVNYRDRERAYFLARSGVNFAGALLSDNLKKGKPQDNLEQRDWQTVPITAGNDTELRVRSEDEGGKISISTVVKDNDAYKRLGKLFEILSINQAALNLIIPSPTDSRKFYLLTELHQFLSDEEFRKIQDFVTVSPVTKIDINTAPSEVLQSLGLSPEQAGMIVERRKTEPFKKVDEVNAFLGPDKAIIVSQLDVTSNVFKVNSFATVGGYTKQVEAVITRTTDIYHPFSIDYWRAL
jgi:general secretion pathway protein K